MQMAITQAAARLEKGCDFTWSDILLLYSAGEESDTLWLPQEVQNAWGAWIDNKQAWEDHGGAVGFVWNKGPTVARAIANAWATVGAVENGEMLLELANAAERYRTQVGEAPLTASTLDALRSQIYSALGHLPKRHLWIPEPESELTEAISEWLTDRALRRRLG
ncbi:MAG: hypothetical protein AAFQ82_06150 [Myxococcota bacterium]